MKNNTLKYHYTFSLLFLIISLTVFMALPVKSSAQSGLSQSQILTGLSQRYKNLGSLETSYTRVAKTPSTEQIFKSGSSQSAAGVLYWASPDSLLVDQKSPQPEVMVTNGQTGWWYIPSEKLVYLYSNVDITSQLKPLLTFLSGLESLHSSFHVSQAPADATRPGQYGLILAPKESGSAADKLTVWCDYKFVLTGIHLASVTGETTDFYFTGLEENPQLSERLFNFKVPKGTEVIEEN